MFITKRPLGPKKITSKQRQLSGRWASTGVDRRRGLPNNRLRDPAGIPDFHPRIHLNDDGGKLSRLMVATRKCKEIYDMQANRRKATWFSMQKLVTDPQPNKIHFDKPTNQTKANPSQVPSNHVRVPTAHDCEHGCYNSFTLCRGCTRYPWVVIILR
jgi:hypothetical protein